MLIFDEYLEIISNQGFQNVTVHKQKEIMLPDEVLEKYYSKDKMANPKNDETGIYLIFASNNFIISGLDDNEEARIFELKSNKFYVVTKFLPRTRSSAIIPHPLVEAFVKAGLN